ncbi:FAD-dependent monooxygenase [Lentibacter algarum]|uniref:FAD-dependent oxidoreductase n=1 Tax=Lentibacter algarum TaxID=576131 RepID=UPI001C077937|nr:FAD-dependent monooxygenase [Lentibacter algarum]
MPHVAIIGAGPTGLTAALELKRLGVDVSIFEKRPGPSKLSRAVGLQAHSLEIFKPSGVADSILAEAISFKGLIFHDQARPLAKLPLNFDKGSQLWGLAQDRTESHIVAALNALGVDVQYGARFETLMQDASSVVATVNGAHKRFDYLIGADGVFSKVRQEIDMSFDGYELDKQWSIADVRCDSWQNPQHFQAFLLEHGNVAVVVPLEAGRFRVISSTPDALKALPVPMNVLEIIRSGTFNISVRQVARYQKGRVFLAGDAAHCHSPVGGRGMNLGIADAADLAARIAAGETEGYTATRHAEGAQVLALSEGGRRMIQSQAPLKRFAVKSAMRVLNHVPPLARFAVRKFTNG